MIMADDLGFECINYYGGTSYKTPFLTELAATGMQFENCNSQTICTPSRLRLMTGRSNKKNHIQVGFLDPEAKTLSQVLRKEGYATLIAGKWHMGKDASLPDHVGLDENILGRLTHK